jgi:hypothetical protein
METVDANASRFESLQFHGRTKASSKKQIDDWIQVFRNTKPAPGTNGPLIQPSTNDMQRPATDQT